MRPKVPIGEEGSEYLIACPLICPLGKEFCDETDAFRELSWILLFEYTKRASGRTQSNNGV